MVAATSAKATTVQRIVHVQEVRDERPQVEVPPAVGKAQEDRAFRGVGPEHLVKDGLQAGERERYRAAPTAASRTTPGTHCSE